MHGAARVRSNDLRLPTRLAATLLFLAAATACGDDGSSSSSDTDGTSGTTTTGTSNTTDPTQPTLSTTTTMGDTTTGSESSDGTSSDGTDSSSTGPSTSSTGDASSSGSSSSTGEVEAVDVPFTLLDPSVLELSARVPVGWVVVTSAAQWSTFTDAPVPKGVSFPDQWVLFGSRGPQPYPGHALVVEALSWRGDTLTVSGESVEPAEECETYEFIWPADTLLVFDALDGDVDTVDDQTAAMEAPCLGGATASASCDLDTPCAENLLCAGIIRSTVLANNPGGLCLSVDNRGSFSGPAFMIPPDGATAEVPLQVDGLTTVDMDVTILLDVEHPAPEELVITLRNPDGNEVSVANLQSTELHPGGVPIVPTGFSGDESVNGTWLLIVRDTVENDNSGSVEGWTLEIMSRLD